MKHFSLTRTLIQRMKKLKRKNNVSLSLFHYFFLFPLYVSWPSLKSFLLPNRCYHLNMRLARASLANEFVSLERQVVEHVIASKTGLTPSPASNSSLHGPSDGSFLSFYLSIDNELMKITSGRLANDHQQRLLPLLLFPTWKKGCH